MISETFIANVKASCRRNCRDQSSGDQYRCSCQRLSGARLRPARISKAALNSAMRLLSVQLQRTRVSPSRTSSFGGVQVESFGDAVAVSARWWNASPAT